MSVPRLLLFLLLTARLIGATEPDPAPKPATVDFEHLPQWSDLFRSSAISFITENDKYFAGTDRHYTNGLKLSFLGETRVDESPRLVRKIAEFVPTLDNQTAKEQTYKVGVSLGQNIYTPSNTDTTAPVPGDRPYAGWLYGALSFQAQSDDSRLLRVVELAVGIVGPAALGQQAQNTVHDLIGVAHANGWANQLHNEPGIELSWERRYRVGKVALPFLGLESDLITRGGVSLGNIRIGATAGCSIRVGWQLPRDFGADLIRLAGGSLGYSQRFSLYAFGSGEARAVAHDIFLDGNTWGDSPSVDKRPLGADLDLGLALRVPLAGRRLKGFQLTYTENYRTKEFYGQAQRDVFGSIGVSLLF